MTICFWIHNPTGSSCPPIGNSGGNDNCFLLRELNNVFVWNLWWENHEEIVRSRKHNNSNRFVIWVLNKVALICLRTKCIGNPPPAMSPHFFLYFAPWMSGMTKTCVFNETSNSWYNSSFFIRNCSAWKIMIPQWLRNHWESVFLDTKLGWYLEIINSLCGHRSTSNTKIRSSWTPELQTKYKCNIKVNL